MRLTRIVVTVLFLIIISGFYSLYNYLDEGLEAQTLQATEESMVDQVHLLAGLIENTMTGDTMDASSIAKGLDTAKQHEFSAKIYHKIKTQVGSNFYITDAKGIVLVDTFYTENIGKNFSHKKDVFLTLQGKYGARSTRINEQDETSSSMFVAAPLHNQLGEIAGVITLYKAQSDVLSFIEGRRQWIISALVLIGFGILAFTVAIFIWLFQPLGKLTQYARSIRDGGRPAFPNLGRGKEVNTLGLSLKEMRESIEGRNYLENYVQILTHELKSPLSAIQGAAELLEEDMPIEQRNKFLSNIREETNRTKSIIDGLLQLSKLESMKQLDHTEFIEVSPLLHEVTELYQNAAEQKKITFQFNVSEQHCVTGDRLTILAAVSNIIQNALEFSHSGDVITLSTDELPNHISIQVTDQGAGIPDYAQDRVFENFYSLSRPPSTKKSSGLGLAFVREIAELHNGSAQLKNNTTGGVTVTLAIQK